MLFLDEGRIGEEGEPKDMFYNPRATASDSSWPRCSVEAIAMHSSRLGSSCSPSRSSRWSSRRRSCDEEERPYVVTAIDYHFHDAHPTLPIGPGRDLIVRNQGRNVHNVTIPALGISRDVRPGGQVVIGSIGTGSPPVATSSSARSTWRRSA